MKSVKSIVQDGLKFFRQALLSDTPTQSDTTHALSLAGAYDLQEQINELNSRMSYVGMVIHSTTLDTEQKVIAQYGGTTWIQHSNYFLRGASSNVVANSQSSTGGSDNAIVPYHNHSFSGTSKSYTSGGPSNNTSGGNSRGHTHNLGGWTISWGNANNKTFVNANMAAGNATNNNPWIVTQTTQDVSQNHTHTLSSHTHSTTITPEGSVGYAGSSGNATNANIPVYKSVYIWERTA